jgi:NMD protein affecting ribosome stability and mRNA decay
MQTHDELHKDMLCPHCGSRIENHRFLKRTDGSVRCENCYFENTYLQGIAQQIEASYLVTLEALVKRD